MATEVMGRTGFGNQIQGENCRNYGGASRSYGMYGYGGFSRNCGDRSQAYGVRRCGEWSDMRDDYRQPLGYGRPVRMGDRMFAHLLFPNGESISFMMDTVGTMTDFIAEIRRRCKGRRGLMRLRIRNATSGWYQERPIMLYPEKEHPVRNGQGAAKPVQRQRMLFPWETH